MTTKKRGVSREVIANCPICLEPWDSSGEHRICALKCGHLFGLKCLQRWADRNLSCPCCKGKIRRVKGVVDCIFLHHR